MTHAQLYLQSDTVKLNDLRIINLTRFSRNSSYAVLQSSHDHILELELKMKTFMWHRKILNYSYALKCTCSGNAVGIFGNQEASNII